MEIHKFYAITGNSICYLFIMQSVLAFKNISKMFCVVFTGQLVDWLTIFLSGYNYKYVCEQIDLNYWRNIHKSFKIDSL